MKILMPLLLLLPSISALANERCEIELGFKNYFFQAKTGSLADANGDGFRLVYWDDNQIQVVTDAKISVLKTNLFHQENVSVNTGMGKPGVNQVTDFAVRLRVETENTEIYPAMMGNSAVKDVTVSTMCTSITSVSR